MCSAVAREPRRAPGRVRARQSPGTSYLAQSGTATIFCRHVLLDDMTRYHMPQRPPPSLTLSLHPSASYVAQNWIRPSLPSPPPQTPPHSTPHASCCRIHIYLYRNLTLAAVTAHSGRRQPPPPSAVSLSLTARKNPRLLEHSPARHIPPRRISPHRRLELSLLAPLSTRPPVSQQKGLDAILASPRHRPATHQAPPPQEP